MTEQHRLAIATRGRGSTDITANIAALVRSAAVDRGIAHIFVRHTSCGLVITENADPAVRHDLETLLRRWAPDGRFWWPNVIFIGGDFFTAFFIF